MKSNVFLDMREDGFVTIADILASAYASSWSHDEVLAALRAIRMLSRRLAIEPYDAWDASGYVYGSYFRQFGADDFDLIDNFDAVKEQAWEYLEGSPIAEDVLATAEGSAS